MAFIKDVAARARLWLDTISQRYKEQIKNSTTCSIIYTCANPDQPTEKRRSRITLYNTDTVTALAKQEEKAIVLNFASYKSPGGGFLNGMMAQEEALCHVSTLFPVLESFEEEYYSINRQTLNRGLYRHTAIYSPDIVFVHEGKDITADVLTCAAPNWGAAVRNEVFFEEDQEEIRERLRFINQILAGHDCKTFIAGAWGCGVFKQDPEFMCRAICEEITYPENLVLAVPPGRNYDAFDKILCEGGKV